MKIVLPGGTGHLGGLLARDLAAHGHEVVILSRGAARPASAAQPWRVLPWDARTLGPWTAALEGANAVINLAGRSVDCRYHAANRRAILESRVESTRVVGEAIARAASPLRAWLQMSTATIYAHRFDAPNDEATGILGGTEPGAPDTWRFSIEVARAWEAEVERAAAPATRKVLLRTAMVMSPERGGVFSVLRRLARIGLGGAIAGGTQYVSWIHGADFARAVRFLLERSDLCGPVNLAAPEPLPHRDFMRALRAACGAPLGLPAATWMVEVGAFFLRTESELVLKSRRVVPGRLTAAGFAFEHPSWPEAARELCARVQGRVQAVGSAEEKTYAR